MATNVNRTEQALRASFATVGNLGNDPETRIAATGTTVTTASIAVHPSYKQGDDWKERTDWFRLVAFGEAGEYLASYRKGERIAIAGRLQSSEYTDREGAKRTSVEVVVLRSDPASLPCRAEPAAAEPEPVADEPEPVAVSEADAQRLPEAKPAKPRRRHKAAA